MYAVESSYSTVPETSIQFEHFSTMKHTVVVEYVHFSWLEKTGKLHDVDIKIEL